MTTEPTTGSAAEAPSYTVLVDELKASRIKPKGGWLGLHEPWPEQGKIGNSHTQLKLFAGLSDQEVKQRLKELAAPPRQLPAVRERQSGLDRSAATEL